jgi:hypothetical protein
MIAEDFFARDPWIVAPKLLNADLFVNGCGGKIVETEAYGKDDEASHSFRGLTPRNAAMFGPPGTVYIISTDPMVFTGASTSCANPGTRCLFARYIRHMASNSWPFGATGLIRSHCAGDQVISVKRLGVPSL